LTDAHGAVPARHEVAHVFNSWTEMPTFREQIDLPWTYRGVDHRPQAAFPVARSSGLC